MFFASGGHSSKGHAGYLLDLKLNNWWKKLWRPIFPSNDCMVRLG